MELKDIIAQQQMLQQQKASLAGASSGLGVAQSGLSMAGQGASLGSAFGPIGTAVGAGAGLIGGLVMGNSKKQEAEDMQAQLNNQNNILENQRLNLQNTTSNEFKLGGQLTRFKGEDHAKGGIRIGKDEVEGEETMLDDYIFSNYLSPKGSNKTFAELTKSIDDKYYRKNDPFSDRAKNSQYEDLRKQQDEINEKYSKAEDVPKEFRCGGSRKVGKDVMGRKYLTGGFYDNKHTSQGMSFLSDRFTDPDPVNQESLPLTAPNVIPGGNELLANNTTNLQSPIASNSTNDFSLPDQSLKLSSEQLMSSAPFQQDPSASSEISKKSGLGVSDLGTEGSSGGNWNQVGSIGGSMLQALPGLIGAATNRNIGQNVDYGRVSPQTVDPNLLDPRRALQETGTAFAGANQSLGNLQGGQYLSNRIASAASEANARAGVAQKYDEANAQILNRSDLSNASARSQANLVNLQQSTQETQDRLQAYGQTGQELSKAASSVLGAYNTNRRDAKMLPYLGTENFPVYMDTAGNPTLDFESSRDGVDYNQNIIGKKARAAKSKKKN